MLTVSTEALVCLFVLLIYALVGMICYWRLFPRLSPTAKALAIGMLAAQVLVILVALEIRPASDYEEWLWHLNYDWNIPATLASTQLALVGGVALFAAWLAGARPAWQRLYLVGIGLVFLFLARDEYVAFHEDIRGWERYYAALGAVVVVTTAAVAARSPRRTWIWHGCLLTGLAMSAAGGLLIEQLRPQLQGPICGSLGILRLDGCLLTFEYEEVLEFAGIWLALIAMLGQLSDATPRLHRRVRGLLYLLPVLWILLLINDPFTHRQFLVQPDAVKFESGVQLLDHRIDRENGSLALQLHATAERSDSIEMGFSVHLVDQVTGISVASRDQHWCCQQGDASVYRQRMELDIAPQAPVNRALWVVLTLWREQDGKFVRQKVLSSDLQLLDETQVLLGELVLPAVSAGWAAVPLASFDNGFALEAVDMPQRAQAGETLSITFAWRSNSDGEEDRVQFLHLGHEETGDWWVYDQQPLGDRLPTRLWYAGLAVSEVWEVPLPADLAPGRYDVFTGLYRRRDLERVAANDLDGLAWVDGRVSLGSLIVEK